MNAMVPKIIVDAPPAVGGDSEAGSPPVPPASLTFFEEHRGWHVQYNIVSRETLLKAREEPQNYRDLVVRVAGYSAFFTALSPEAQDDIIARTEHSL